ncbi:hypothetical protein KFU94_30195 [Chloroflexi bacterium TSY]|nr:hypothetical protein [Chloroflexi bacterium TSY]
MAFSDFTNIAEVQQAYQIQHAIIKNLVQPHAFTPSESYTQLFGSLPTMIYIQGSEAIHSHAAIFPMLLEAYRSHAEKLAFWSGEWLAVPGEPKLSGNPGFMVSPRSPLGIAVIDKPYMIIVEAKQDNFTNGWGQCLAAMVAAQKINGDQEIPIFGIVTNGTTWQMGRLQGNKFQEHEESLSRSVVFDYLNTIFDVVANITVSRSQN